MSITVNIRYSGKGNAAVDFAKEMRADADKLSAHLLDTIRMEMFRLRCSISTTHRTTARIGM